MPAKSTGRRDRQGRAPRPRRRPLLLIAVAAAALGLAGVASAATLNSFSRGPTFGPSITRTPTDGVRPTNIGPRFPSGVNTTPDGPGTGNDPTTNPNVKAGKKDDDKKTTTTRALRAGFVVPSPNARN